MINLFVLYYFFPIKRLKYNFFISSFLSDITNLLYEKFAFYQETIK